MGIRSYQRGKPGNTKKFGNDISYGMQSLFSYVDDIKW